MFVYYQRSLVLPNDLGCGQAVATKRHCEQGKYIFSSVHQPPAYLLTTSPLISQIRMLGDDWKTQLKKYFEPSGLPKQYGGTLDVSFEPLEEHDVLSSEASVHDTMTVDEVEHDIAEMIEEFRREESQHAGTTGSSVVCLLFSPPHRSHFVKYRRCW